MKIFKHKTLARILFLIGAVFCASASRAIIYEFGDFRVGPSFGIADFGNSSVNLKSLFGGTLGLNFLGFSDFQYSYLACSEGCRAQRLAFVFQLPLSLRDGVYILPGAGVARMDFRDSNTNAYTIDSGVTGPFFRFGLDLGKAWSDRGLVFSAEIGPLGKLKYTGLTGQEKTSMTYTQFTVSYSFRGVDE